MIDNFLWNLPDSATNLTAAIAAHLLPSPTRRLTGCGKDDCGALPYMDVDGLPAAWP
jgi:hypothetical protein